MKKNKHYEADKHPWQLFLNARAKAIIWLKNEMNQSDVQIACQLSMDEKQVMLIRTYIEEKENK